MAARYEIIDNNHPTWRGSRFSDEMRARRVLAQSVGEPGRWSLKDRTTRIILATK
jgi:hypothetical protein